MSYYGNLITENLFDKLFKNKKSNNNQEKNNQSKYKYSKELLNSLDNYSIDELKSNNKLTQKYKSDYSLLWISYLDINKASFEKLIIHNYNDDSSKYDMKSEEGKKKYFEEAFEYILPISDYYDDYKNNCQKAYNKFIDNKFVVLFKSDEGDLLIYSLSDHKFYDFDYKCRFSETTFEKEKEIASKIIKDCKEFVEKYEERRIIT